MKDERQQLIAQLEEKTDCDVYILFTATCEKPYSVALDFLPLFTEAIFSRRGKRRENAIIIFETNRGDPTIAMAIVKQLRESYKKIYGYAFNRCFSAGTIAMFATDKIFMSRYALFTPIDLQSCITGEENYRPIIANFNAFISRTRDERENEFLSICPAEYVNAITTIRYSLQTLYPNFARHCKTSMVESSWEYFNGGAGLHTAKISRTQAIKELGLKISVMQDDIEEILHNLINDYISSTSMLADSLQTTEDRNAYFETLGLTYTHYAIYQQFKKKVCSNCVQNDEESESDLRILNADLELDDNLSEDMKITVTDKYCIETGWKII